MFLAFFSTILNSFAQVFWKKSLKYKVRPLANNVSVYAIPLVMLAYMISFSSPFQVADIFGIAIAAIIVIIDILRTPLQQKIVSEEKISVLIPFTNLNKIFVIILSFFIFQDVSVISLGITLLTIVVIMAASFDFKNRRLPRNFMLILGVEFLMTLATILSGWFILKYSDSLLFCLYTIIGFLFFSVLTIKGRQLEDLKNAPARYWGLRYVGGLGWISWFIGLIVIKNLGLSISILLGFLGIGITLAVSYLFLNDKPSKKDILLTVTVAILIGIGYYFK